MAVEAKRGCGYRRVGGLYLAGGKLGRPCGKIPLVLDVCPTCHGGIKPTRGWTWVDPVPLLAERDCTAATELCAGGGPLQRRACPLREPMQLGRCGLLWIGEKFYPTPEHFLREGVELGISRRLTAVPKDIRLGKTRVLLAHRGVDFRDGGDLRPGIFATFVPQRIEKIVTESEARDELEMAKLRARGITPVAVPDDDPDHNPGAAEHDADQEDPF